MRIAVTGARGQVATALQSLKGIDVVAYARPDLDLAIPSTVAPILRAGSPDVIVNAAAYTAVDRAEQEASEAFAINEAGARAVAEAAAGLGVPLIHLSTDYVFDGAKPAPYVETDAPNPQSVYGASKYAGERAVMQAHARAVIVRASWVYAPHGNNFVRTMLRLAGERDAVRVVADQRGMPMAAPDIAEALARVARNLVDAPERGNLHGLFHLGGEGDTTWADFAEATFAGSAARGGPSARVERITTAEFGAPAPRPPNSRLDGAKLEAAHGVRLPHWRTSLDRVLDTILRG
ncbi:MAG: dTDP-4-dehydrorhamnose reductase [Hyphomonadaceae bacterium]